MRASHFAHLVLVLATAGLSSCANFAPLPQQAHRKLVPLAHEAKQFAAARDVVENVTGAGPGPLVHEVDVANPANTVSLSVQDASFYALAQSIAGQHGYTVAVLDGVNPLKTVNIDFKGLTFDAAMRYIGLVAGYVAVISQDNHTVTFAKTATYTFRLPTGLMHKMEADFKVGGDPTEGGGQGSSGSTSGGSTSGGSGGTSGPTLSAKFTVTGNNKQADGSGLQTYLQQQGGQGAQVLVFPASGFVTVRGNAVALRRIHEFLQTYTQDAMRQVQIQASLVEVSLNDTLQYGIQWNKILNAAGTKSIGYNTTSVVSNPALNVNLTTASITAIMKALEDYTTVKVVSQPSLVAANHTAATKFDGVQDPYLPSVNTTLSSGTGGFSQTSGSVAYALDGVSFSVTADILSNQEVSLRLVPVSNTVGTMQTFLNGQIQAPVMSTKQSLMQVLVPTGYTVVLAGDRYMNGNDATQGIPGVARLPGVGRALSGVNDVNAARENVLLLQVQIVPAPTFQTLVGEAI